ncbi:hypothetical protein BDY19DRAFT_947182 [Irpex rosettiformis]|uniref:Uncharacterized protein n=1 Tax=Irpex rosettiformis TaxID=378272 RepID=A0ACB8U400_9APHY|nr:hypothetical protein BDY19DRAFT_947182 [Irpex rosettiformis]
MSLAPLLGGSPVTMSYQYPPYAVNYSNHSTPPSNSFWDVEQQHQDVMEASTSISPQVFQQQLSPMDSPISLDHQQHQQPQQHASPSYEPPSTIQIQERVQPSQFRFENIDESHFLQQQEDSTETCPQSTGKAVSRVSEEMRKSTSPSSAGAGPSRVPHGKMRAQSHPYRRRSAASPTVDASSRSAGMRAASSSTRAEKRDSEALGERSSQLRRDVPPTVGSSMALSCPASATHMWRISPHSNAESGDKSVPQRVTSSDPSARDASNISYEDQATSPMAEGPSVLSAGMGPPGFPFISRPSPLKRMLIRTDVHFDIATNEMTAVLELPGLKKHDLTIQMRMCPYSRVQQIIITGRSRPALPQGIYTIQERKFGDFFRTVVVPVDTKPEDIVAKMEDGILTLKVPCGTPAQEHEEPHDIAIQ